MSRQDFSHTVRNELRDFVEWHRGRSPYVLWALDIDCAPIVAEVHRAAEFLGSYLLPGYVRQPHVTLGLCGFPMLRALAQDEFCSQDLVLQVERLKAAAPRPFELSLGQLESFATAPYLSVAASDDALGQLRDALGSVAPAHGRYVPHVTVGLYAVALPISALARRIADYPPTCLRCSIEQVSLMAYDPPVIGGALSTLGRFSLKEQRMEWHGAMDDLFCDWPAIRKN